MRLRIIVDDQDRQWAPQQPYTLNVYRDDDDGTESRFQMNVEAIVGGDIPAMLTELVEQWPDIMEAVHDV